nr:hypothetical protein [Planctomycetota bacterium]
EAKPRLGATPFVGYDEVEAATEITLLEVGGAAAASAPTGTAVRFALARTPFYAESGGQVGDTGKVAGADFEIRVTDVQKDEGLVIHSGEVVAGAARGGAVTAKVDADKRKDITRHHTATHLLHAALGRVLGDHVEQQGSKVEAGSLRFDFNNPGAMTREQLAAVENWVNEQIHAGHPVAIAEMPVDDAKKLGAKAQFGEKYGKSVRVISVAEGSVSRELCGGCHVRDTREIRAFRIVREEASSAGVRRVTAVAGRAALALAAEEAEVAAECGELFGMARVEDPRAIDDIARELKVTRKELPARLAQLRNEARELAGKLLATLIEGSGDLAARVDHLQTELRRLRKLNETKQAQAAAGQADDLIAQVREVAGVPLLAVRVDGLDAKALSQLADVLKSKQASLCLVLAGEQAGKAVVLAAVSKDLVARRLSAGNLVKQLAEQLGGRGGGKPELAQGGGPDPSRLDAVLAGVPALVQQAVAGAGSAS